jgi:hypothetical protein
VSGRPVRRRVLADVERAGGWGAVLARIGSGEPVAKHCSLGVSRGLFTKVLEKVHERYALITEPPRAAMTTN